MVMIDALLKFPHTAVAIVRVRGVASRALLGARIARGRDGVAPAAGAAALYGQAVLVPAALVTLLAGVGTAVRGGFAFGSPWIVWGFTGVAAFLLLGADPIRQATERLAAGPGDPAALRRRLTILGAINVLLLLSVVWAIVAKPAG